MPKGSAKRLRDENVPRGAQTTGRAVNVCLPGCSQDAASFVVIEFRVCDVRSASKAFGRTNYGISSQKVVWVAPNDMTPEVRSLDVKHHVIERNARHQAPGRFGMRTTCPQCKPQDSTRHEGHEAAAAVSIKQQYAQAVQQAEPEALTTHKHSLTLIGVAFSNPTEES